MSEGKDEAMPMAREAGVRVDEQVWRVPAPRVRPLVSWYSGFRQAGGDPATHRGLPSPALTFIITLDDPVVIAAHPDPRQAPGAYDTLIGGLHTAPALITHGGRQSGIQLALTPLGARALLGMPAGELANWDGDTAAVEGGAGGGKGSFGQFAGELRERVLSCGSWPERFAVIDAMVARRALGASDGLAFRGVRAEVGYAWRRLAAARGGVTVADLAAETGCSERYLNSLFRAEVGLAPKAAARVFRFDHARRRISAAARARAQSQPGQAATAAPASLADLAADCGYYDQAHLAREFRDLAGCPPSQWLAEEFRFVQAAHGDSGESSGS